MSKNVVLITEDNKEYLNGIEHTLRSQGYHVVWIGSNGKEVVEQANRLRPTAILMSTFMPELDAMGVLKELHLLNNTSACFVFGISDSTKIIQRIMECGAEYYFYLPLSINVITERILDMIRPESTLPFPQTDYLFSNHSMTNADVELTLTECMHQLGIPANIKGYQFLRLGILMAFDSPDLLDAVTKELYPDIAKRTGSTSSRVERAIRHAIEVAWSRGNVKAQENLFGYTINVTKGKPTNSEFIAMMVDTLRQKYRTNVC